jgi:hypothetical protein
MEEIEVIKFCRETHKPLDKKNMKNSDWLNISKKVYTNFYYKAYQLGYSQFFNN